jgi:hypothetical protein
MLWKERNNTMQNIATVLCTIVLIIIDLAVALLFTFMIEEMLRKDQKWFPLLLTILGILLLQAAVYSWLPARMGMEIQILDGAIVLRDGALFSNLGALLLAQGIAIGIALCKHLWGVIRKREKFAGAAFWIELAFLAAFFAGGSSMFEEYPSSASIVPSGTLAAVGAAVPYCPFRESCCSKKYSLILVFAETDPDRKLRNNTVTGVLMSKPIVPDHPES